MFLVILAVAGVLTVFFSSAYFLYRSYFARGSSFFSYSSKIAGFREKSPGDLLGIPGGDVRQEELAIKGCGGVTLKGDLYAKRADAESRANVECAGENDVESGRSMAADFVSELQTGELDLLANAFVDDVRDNASET